MDAMSMCLLLNAWTRKEEVIFVREVQVHSDEIEGEGSSRSHRLLWPPLPTEPWWNTELRTNECASLARGTAKWRRKAELL